MAKAACSDDEFIALFESIGAEKTAERLGITARGVYARRARLEVLIDRPLTPMTNERRWAGYAHRLTRSIPDGVIIVGGDAHYWPGSATTAHRGYVHLCRELQPKIACLNGDVFDGARASRHAAIGWANPPTVQEELEACEMRTDEIRAAAKGAELIWTLGNHDMRFESRISEKLPELAGVKGARLSDHFPHWQFALTLWVNGDTVIKHRWKGGVHATHNNTLNAGKNMVTNHLHSLKVTPFTDYNGTRYGVDCGTLSEPDGSHADYDEDNPKNHRSGGMVLTFRNGKLLWPEPFSTVDEKHIQFRGNVIEV